MLAAVLSILAQTSAPAAVATPAPSPPPAAKPGSAQAAFDAATEAYANKQWPEAVRLFDAIEARLGTKASKSVLATINLRRGVALKRTGDYVRAEPMLRSAMDAIAPDDPALASERFDALIELGIIVIQRGDFDAALAIAQSASATAKAPVDRLNAALLGVRSTMFDGGAAALAYADAADRAVSEMPQTGKKGIADIDTLRARLLINRGRAPEAYALLKKALSRQGGLDTKVTLAEIVTRSDLAIAALLNKDLDAAREYLAFTGSGRIAESPFGRASAMNPPLCGERGIAPEDSAIVEFGLNETGAVGYAQTVYMSRPSRTGAKAFSDAVREWTWQPSAIKRIPAFYKALTRVELRCTNATARPELTQAFNRAIGAYLTFAKRSLPTLGVDAATLPAMRAELDRRKAVPGDALAAPVALAISMNPAASDGERRRTGEDALSLLPADAPLIVRAAVAFSAATASSDSAEAGRRAYRVLLARPEFAADPEIAAILRLSIARPGFRAPAPADAEPLIRAVVDDARIAKDDPLRTAALIQLANLQWGARQADAAARTFAQTGLTGDQCALLDTPPAVIRTNVSDSDFPQEAQAWGFEGWTRIEQDITADGRAKGTRVVIAYPPFVFSPASNEMASKIRYQATFRPGSTVGCTASQQSINFRIAK